MSRCGMPSISKPTMNFFTVADRSSGGEKSALNRCSAAPRRSQQRRVEMRMEVLLGARPLMEPHRVREAGLEKVVVSTCQLAQDIGQSPPLRSAELRQLA